MYVRTEEPLNKKSFNKFVISLKLYVKKYMNVIALRLFRRIEYYSQCYFIQYFKKSISTFLIFQKNRSCHFCI